MPKIINAIILAAGKGKRLKNFNKPKSLIVKNKKYLIEHIIENFKKNKIKNISVVTGYKSKELVKAVKGHKVKFIFNKKWKNTNMFYSLLMADKVLRKNFSIISYADIFYKSQAIRILKNSKNDVSLTSYTKWKQLWKKRFSNPLLDLESFKINKDNYISEIGLKPKKYNEIKGQYMGLFAISRNGWKKIKTIIFSNSLNINNLSITKVLNFVIKKNVKIKALNYSKNFFEVDFKKDLKMLTKKIKK